ncbi:hypothetical protein B7R21_17535 [Subtercola boreus]|uniref:UPF0311 protein B7R21_17535 n=2 Tax=Subtercola boreus TaxID=120213 RepID=A0A3E0VDM4_9MICO|nr:hypothetical protein B7R21_17535 [Subtercola boreus]
MTVPPVPSLTRCFDVVVHLGPIEDHGPTRVGHRRVVPISGGEITGDIEATVLPGGADWQVVRPDGTVELDARYSARTRGGGLVLIHAAGVRTGTPKTLQALLDGSEVAPDSYYFRTQITLECAHDPELERRLFIGSCLRTRDAVRYVAYRVD